MSSLRLVVAAPYYETRHPVYPGSEKSRLVNPVYNIVVPRVELSGHIISNLELLILDFILSVSFGVQ